MPGCWQLLCCCQHPELLLESSLEQHSEVGAASRGAGRMCCAGPKPQRWGTLKQRHLLERALGWGSMDGHERQKKGPIGKGMSKSFALPGAAQLPGLLCADFSEQGSTWRWGWLSPSDPVLCLSPVGLRRCRAQLRRGWPGRVQRAAHACVSWELPSPVLGQAARACSSSQGLNGDLL